MKTFYMPTATYAIRYKRSKEQRESHTILVRPYLKVQDDGAVHQSPGLQGFGLPEMSASKDVLVVEDEPYLCDLVADVLEAEGHHARKASNGADALAQLAQRAPQLILLDLMMPVMDGWEFMAAIKANPKWQRIPVVIITAVYDVASTQRATGADAVITKPFDIDQLADVVRSYAV